MRAISRYPAQVLVSLLSAALLLVYLLTSTAGYDLAGHVIGRDFMNTHLGGQLISASRIDVLFDSEGYWHAVRALHGAEYPVHNWSYPPLLWPASQGLALLPYFWAYAIWTAVGVGLVFLAVRLLNLAAIWGVFIVLSPAGMWNLLAGQNGFIFSALLVIAVVLTHQNRALRAGLSWAVLAVKPHLGLCVIPFLFALKKWRVIAWGAALLLAAFAGTVWAYGLDVWRQFLTVTAAQQTAVVETWQGLVTWTIPSAFMQGRLLGLEAQGAYVLHLAVALIAVVLLVLRWPGREAELRAWVLWLVLGTLILLPYSFVYDMVMWHFALALFAADPGALLPKALGERRALAVQVLWVMPWLCVFVAMLFSVQILPVVLLLLLATSPGLRSSAPPRRVAAAGRDTV